MTVPKRSAGYSGKPLASKLGVKDGSRVLVTGAPDAFDLGAPHDTRPDDTGPYDIVLLFSPDLATLRQRWDDALARITPNGTLWIAWPKRSSGVPTDLTENVIRDVALPRGVVDVKVCAVDDTWSGLKLVWRLANRR